MKTSLVLSRDEVRAVDRRAVDEFHMPSVILMENAGRGAAELLLSLGIRGRVVVCAGRGNNGGDGFVIARHLENHGIDVRVLLFAERDGLRGDAEINARILEAAETPLRALGTSPELGEVEAELEEAQWIVDALLGTGLQGRLREPYPSLIGAINRASAQVLAVDLPSGMDCDTGEPLGDCVRAEHTATFVARKRGFEAPGASEWTGEVHVIGIGVPRKLLEA